MHFFPVLPPPVVTQSSEAEIKTSFIILYILNVEKYQENTVFRYPYSYYLPLLGLDNMHTIVKIKIDLTRHNTMVCSF